MWAIIQSASVGTEQQQCSSVCVIDVHPAAVAAAAAVGAAAAGPQSVVSVLGKEVSKKALVLACMVCRNCMFAESTALDWCLCGGSCVVQTCVLALLCSFSCAWVCECLLA
jgi:hypothetical protein